MTVGTGRPRDWSPAWLKDLGAKWHQFTYQRSTLWAPDFNCPIFLDRHLAFIDAMGRRYNGRPEIALVDIGSVGLWGEWHMSGTTVPMPTDENARTIVDAYAKAFPDTPLAMQMDHVAGEKRAIEDGLGWRVDCWGDMGGFSKSWCHMRTLYPQAFKETGAEDAWRKGPVALETCWDMRRWHDEGWDLDFILNWALDKHATYINNKSEPVPADYLPKVETFEKKLGYRIVLRSATFPQAAAPGAALEARMTWANVGVAPCYHDFYPALALADASGKVAWSRVFENDSIRSWLPGETSTALDAALPATLAPGAYTLLVGITDKTASPAVRLAIEGRRDDGWYPLGTVDVK